MIEFAWNLLFLVWAVVTLVLAVSTVESFVQDKPYRTTGFGVMALVSLAGFTAVFW